MGMRAGQWIKISRARILRRVSELHSIPISTDGIVYCCALPAEATYPAYQIGVAARNPCACSLSDLSRLVLWRN
jgi:hypothetical protein